MKKTLTALMVIFALTAAGLAFASGSFKPPPSAPKDMVKMHEIKLMPASKGGTAKGTMNIDCYKDGKDLVDIRLEKLPPGKVFTVWAMVGNKKMGVGRKPYSFKSRSTGKARFVSRLDQCPMGKWDVVMIVEHKDGNPENMAKANLVPYVKSEKLK